MKQSWTMPQHLLLTAGKVTLAASVVILPSCGTTQVESESAKPTETSTSQRIDDLGVVDCEELVGAVYDPSSPPAACASQGDVLSSSFYDCSGVLTVTLADYLWAAAGTPLAVGEPDLQNCQPLP